MGQKAFRTWEFLCWLVSLSCTFRDAMHKGFTLNLGSLDLCSIAPVVGHDVRKRGWARGGIHKIGNQQEVLWARCIMYFSCTAVFFSHSAFMLALCPVRFWPRQAIRQGVTYYVVWGDCDRKSLPRIVSCNFYIFEMLPKVGG